jgi:phosphomannomutase
MSSKLMRGVSGIRGIVGETFTPELMVRVGSAFAEFVRRGTVVIGRDSRSTGDAIAKNIESILILSGCDVIDTGIIPTPTVQLMVEELKAAGGIVISASHNSIEWNAFKLINRRGVFLNASEMSRIFSLMEGEFKYKRWNKIGNIHFFTDAEAVHINRILKVIDKKKIRERRFRVVLDSVNGAGSLITQRLLSELGCEVIPVHCDITGTFPRGAEPVPSNLKDLSARVIKESADIGFAQDPDADRLAIVNERGMPIGEENTIALVVEHLLSKKSGRVVINLSTTKAVEDIAKRYSATVKRTAVGEIHVVDYMRRYGARIGGEGNGGVISPEVHLGRDSLVGIAYILEMLSEKRQTVSQIVSALPHYVMKKGKVRSDDKKKYLSSLKKTRNLFKGERITDIDGLRIDFTQDRNFSGGWVHLRPSNTEPVFRIIAEGTTRDQADSIYRYFARIFRD